jgi:hypothetical protein
MLKVHWWLYRPLSHPGLFINFVIFFTRSVEFFGWVISPSQGIYLHIGQHKHRINADANADIHALSGIRTHDSSVWASEDNSCNRPLGHCGRLVSPLEGVKMAIKELRSYAYGSKELNFMLTRLKSKYITSYNILYSKMRYVSLWQCSVDK